MIQRIYIDTSIVGGFFDKEFEVFTEALFDRLANGEIRFVVSDLLAIELIPAPEHVRNLLAAYPNGCFERVVLSAEAEKLAERYIQEGVVGRTSIVDCQHIALATILHCHVLASWNFKHIVNLDRIRGYNSVNFREGYPMIEIRSPLELATTHEKRD